jgi:Major Facilitator Superfamily
VREPATRRSAASSGLISAKAPSAKRPSWSPWRTVVGFGVVSLAADMVYEGARSVTGPLLASLGASAVLVGLVSGAGEATALLMRVVFGSWADRRRSYWMLTFVGYGLTAACVPALAITPFLASVGLVLACALTLGERLGKAVRSPAKTALLAHAATAVGLGRGFGVHQALDQIGAVAGPLLVAAVVAAVGTIWPAMAVLIIPGAVAMLLLVRIWRSMGNPILSDEHTSPHETAAAPEHRESLFSRLHGRLPGVFWLFAGASAAISAGLVTFRRHRLSPHARSCRIRRGRSVDLRRSDGCVGASRARIRLAL